MCFVALWGLKVVQKMAKSITLILADDLTGANDTAIQFKKYGCSTLLVTNIIHADKAFLNDYDVVAINTDSRRMNPEDAYHVTHQAVKMFETARNKNFVYKKVDSMLRGNPGEELAAVMDALEIPLALAAPAFPANRSTLAHGRLPSGADAVQIFAAGSGRNTENIPLETIRQGATFITAFVHNRNSKGTQIFVADAENDADLKTIYTASTCLEKPHILAGSAGLANQIARNLGKEESINSNLPANAVIAGLTSNPKTLVIAGSRQKETATQLLTLSQSLSIPIILFKVSLVIEGKTDEAIKMAYNEAAELMQRQYPAGSSRPGRMGCQKYGVCFSKTRSQNVVSKNPYFQKAPLIEKWTQSSFPLIPLFPVNPETCKVRRRQRLDEVNKGIRVDEKEAALLLRGILQNKGSMKKKNEYIFAPIAHFVQPISRIISDLRPTGSGRPSRSDRQSRQFPKYPCNTPVCIIAVDSMFHNETVNQHYAECDEMGKHISGALGILTKKLFDGFHFSLLISTGGDTSMGICQQLEISGIEPFKEICPGIPLSRIVGGAYDGRFMITKSGRFGEADTLVKIMDSIHD